MSKTKDSRRVKRTVYTDNDPGLEELIQKAVADGRVFTTFACLGIREWLMKNGYGKAKA